tara:strand:- start:6325 stop:7383 length:1059 start_codon:yes stop_codon:yes gene_type:complete
MLIQVEGTCLFQEKPSGISSYCQNLIKGLQEYCDPEVILPYSRVNKYLKHRNQKNHNRIKFKNYNLDLPWRRESLFHGVDMVLPKWTRSKKVLTIHDIYLFLDQREEISSKTFREKKLKQLKESISMADHFISVSQKTKEDFCDFFSIPESKVSVTHLGYRKPEQIHNNSNNLNLPEKYILFVGTLSERKNCLRMLEAFSRLHDKSLHFIFAGGKVPNYPFFEKIKSLKLESRVQYFDYVTDSDLSTLYFNATAFIFPTLYEGFGIPLLEAASIGLPVLTSNRGAAPEVLGKLGIYADPFSVDEIRDGMEKVLNLKEDLEFKSQLISHADTFSWNKTAKETFEIYKKVTESI